MKKSLLFFITFFALQNLAMADSLKWSDVELHAQYKLLQTISFPGVADFHAKGAVQVLDISPADAGITYYQVHLSECQNSALEADMILVNPSPEDTTGDRSVGVQLASGCILNVYVDGSDSDSKSLFY